MSDNDRKEGELLAPVQETSKDQSAEEPAVPDNTYITKTIDALSAR